MLQLRQDGRFRVASTALAALVIAWLLVPTGSPPAFGQEARRPEYAPVVDDPSLPRVLLIGDSISIGYTLFVRELLAGKANVHRPPTNCGPTTRGREHIDEWLGDGRWDVIHFNWGLHDLKYMGPRGENRADPALPGSYLQVPPGAYEKHLRALVARLEATGATLVWATTTPVPEGATGRVPGDAARYNRIARRVMDEQKVRVNDLHGFARPRLAELQRPADVHFSPEGSKALAARVAAAIEAALAARAERSKR